MSTDRATTPVEYGQLKLPNSLGADSNVARGPHEVLPVKNRYVPLFGTMYRFVPLCSPTDPPVHPLLLVIYINRNVS